MYKRGTYIPRWTWTFKTRRKHMNKMEAPKKRKTTKMLRSDVCFQNNNTLMSTLREKMIV